MAKVNLKPPGSRAKPTVSPNANATSTSRWYYIIGVVLLILLSIAVQYLLNDYKYDADADADIDIDVDEGKAYSELKALPKRTSKLKAADSSSAALRQIEWEDEEGRMVDIAYRTVLEQTPG